MKRILAFAALSLATAACVTRTLPVRNMFPDGEPVPSETLLEAYYRPTRSVHPTRGDTITDLMVQDNFRSGRVACSNLDSPPVRVTLTLRKHAPHGMSALTLLRVDYEEERPLGPDADRALQLHLDEATIVPTRFGNPTRATRYGASETIQFLVSPAVLQEIATAERTSARLSGRRGRCDFPITGHARGLIAMFAERELGAPALETVSLHRGR